MQPNGLQERYGQDADFALAVRMIPALAFVPVGDEPYYYDALENSLPEDVDPILNYFEEYYVGRLRANGQRPTPMFPIPLWNVHNGTMLGQDRTNNAHVGWHRRFVSQLTCHHPTLWKFINCLKAEEKSTKQRCEQLLAGDQPPRRKKKYEKRMTARVTIVSEDRLSLKTTMFSGEIKSCIEGMQESSYKRKLLASSFTVDNRQGTVVAHANDHDQATD